MPYRNFTDIFFRCPIAKGFATLLFAWGITAGTASQVLSAPPATVAGTPRPKLVVVVSVDQFCQDYLVRFADNLAKNNGLVAEVRKQGLEFAECQHRHAFTVTAPGHSVQLTGAYPNVNGIVGNDWFDAIAGGDRYCVEDKSVQVVGIPTGKGMSPRSLLVETVGDSLKRTYPQAKVFGIAVKDRAAILMSGHRANCAFWMASDNWVTSTYYRDDLPVYLRILNEGKMLERYRGATWDLLLPKEKYVNTVAPDKNDWENAPAKYTTDFPHKLYGKDEGKPDDFADQVLFSPFGNEVTLQGARAVVEGEQLGKDEIPDLLTINLSSNDYIGHAFGPDSLEVEDMTYRTDRMLKEFTDFLNEHVGAGQWVLALTADHGVAPIVEFAKLNKLPAERNPLGDTKELSEKLAKILRDELSLAEEIKPIEKVTDGQIYLRHGKEGIAGSKRAAAAKIVRDYLLNQDKIATAVTREDVLSASQNPLHAALSRACHPQRSGDVLFVYRPYAVPGTKGTTHGSPWRYDTHVPMLLIGQGIPQGETRYEPVSPANLAATVAKIFGCATPTAAVEPALTLKPGTEGR